MLLRFIYTRLKTDDVFSADRDSMGIYLIQI